MTAENTSQPMDLNEEPPAIALLIGALLSLLVAGAGWIWRKPAEKNVVKLEQR